jgi:hypothetical protein
MVMGLPHPGKYNHSFFQCPHFGDRPTAYCFRDVVDSHPCEHSQLNSQESSSFAAAPMQSLATHIDRRPRPRRRVPQLPKHTWLWVCHTSGNMFTHFFNVHISEIDQPRTASEMWSTHIHVNTGNSTRQRGLVVIISCSCTHAVAGISPRPPTPTPTRPRRRVPQLPKYTWLWVCHTPEKIITHFFNVHISEIDQPRTASEIWSTHIHVNTGNSTRQRGLVVIISCSCIHAVAGNSPRPRPWPRPRPRRRVPQLPKYTWLWVCHTPEKINTHFFNVHISEIDQPRTASEMWSTHIHVNTGNSTHKNGLWWVVIISCSCTHAVAGISPRRDPDPDSDPDGGFLSCQSTHGYGSATPRKI